MPGATVCGSCRRALNEAPAASEAAEPYVPVAEIYPPRASKRTARQQVEAHSPTYRAARDAGRRDVEQTKEDWAEIQNRAFNIQLAWQWWWPALTSLVPGLGQMLQHRVLTGIILFAAALLCLGLGVVALHNPLSNILLLVLLGIIGYSVFDAAQQSFPPSPNEQIGFFRHLRLGLLSISLVSLLVMGFFGLVSLRYSLWTLADNQAAPSFQMGDSLIMEGFAGTAIQDIERGDVIVFRGTIERVIGLPSDKVTFRKGVLTVNGKALGGEELPLTFRPNNPEFDLRVSANLVLVWRPPLNIVQADDVEGVQTYALIQLDDIEGRLVGLYNPPARRRWIVRRNTQ